MIPTFVDTSAHYAIADIGDKDHDSAQAFLKIAVDEIRAFITIDVLPRLNVVGFCDQR